MIWLLPLVLACAPKTPVTRVKGMERSPSTLEALQQARTPRRHAILVGVDRYDDPAFKSLRHAAEDAVALGERLEQPSLGGFGRVVVVENATRSEVIAALREVGDDLRREDVLVVYFSGHGTRLRDGDQWRRFLVVRDTEASDLSRTALDLGQLQAFFSSLAPARKALIVDACFNGDGKSSVRPEDRDLEGVVSLGALAPLTAEVGPGEAHLFATSAGRPSLEDDTLGHGVYTHGLLDALSWSFADADVDGDGVVTAWEAHDHARSWTLDYTRDVQVPEGLLHVVGEADVVLAGTPDRRRSRDQALVYLYATRDHELDGATLLIDGREKGVLPRTVPVAAGRHRVMLRDAEGNVVIDGYLRLVGGRAYKVDDVARLAQGPRRSLGLRLTGVASPPLERAIGVGAVGPEIWWASRVNQGSAQGLTRGISLGAAASPSRSIGGVVTTSMRPLLWSAGSLGYQQDLRQLRLRVGWGGSLVWVPTDWIGEAPSDKPAPYDALSEAGWFFAATGPTTSAGVVLGRGWTATATVRPHFGVLDTDGTGSYQLVPWVVAGLGFEADL